MREIDAEAPVVWPAWCYSANTQEHTLDVISRKGGLTSEALPQRATSPSSFIQTSTTVPASTISNSVGTLNKVRAKRKTSHTTSLTAATGSTVIAAEAAKSEKLYLQQNQQQQQQSQLSSFLIKKSPSAEKMLSERMLMGFNSTNSNKKHCDNSSSLLYDKVKNESQMDSLKNGDLSTNNNNVTNNSGNNSIKRERLSPTANGDVQSSISRSRSATPSSFPGTPPQPVHPNDIVSQNILSSTRSNEFQARNYSEFMRNLAAKYNNSNPNDSASARSLFFDQKYSLTSAKTSNKESPSPPELKRQSLQTLTPPHVPSVPFVSSLFSGLPFSPAVFPPLIDMSSTQALVTLARAAKEAEIQNILRSAQKRPSMAQSISPANRTNLTPTPQQSAPYTPQAFILPSQYQGHPTQTPSRSPTIESNPVTSNPAIASPLDLSSTPQSKRLKIESPSSPRTSPTREQSLPVQHLKSESGTSCCANSTGSRSVLSARHCQAQSEEINSWRVDEVCNFVGSIDICSEYEQNFRDQCIDGSGLPLLTEDHLTNSLGMKLGPALKLRSILAKKLGGPCPCVSCTTITQQAHLATSTASSSASSTSSSLSGSGSGPINPNSHTANTGPSTSANIPIDSGS